MSKFAMTHHSGLAGLLEIAPDWDSLVSCVSEAGIQHSPSSFEALLRYRHKKPGNVVFFVLREQSGRLVAVCPLEKARRLICRMPFRLWQPPVDPDRPTHDFVVAPEVDRHFLFDRLLRASRDLYPEADLLAVDRAEQGSSLAEILTFEPQRSVAKSIGFNQRIATTQSIAEIIGHTRKKFRSNLRRGWRDLHAAGGVEYRVARRPLEVGAAFDDFVKLELSGWKGEQAHGRAIGRTEEKTETYRREIALFATRARCEVHSLWVREDCVASLVGLRERDEFYVFKIAFSEKWGSASPGHLLMEGFLRECCSRPDLAFCNIGSEADWFRVWHPTITPLWHGYVSLSTVAGRFAISLLGLRGWPRPFVENLYTCRTDFPESG